MKFFLYLALVILPFGKLLSVPLGEAGGKVFLLVPFDLVLLCLSASCLWHAWTTKNQVKLKSGVTSSTLVFICWAGFSLAFNVFYFRLGPTDALFSSLYLVRWIECFAFFYAAKEVVTADALSAEKLFSVLWIGAACFSIFGIVQSIVLPDFALTLNPEARPYTDFDPQGHRLVSSFLDPNITAGYLVLFGVMLLAMYIEGDKVWLRRFVLCTLALMLTLSRGGLLGFGVGISLLLVRGGRKARRVAAVMLSMIAVAALLYPFVKSELEDTQRMSVSDDSAMIRIQRWTSGLIIAEDNLITGVGFNTLGFVSPVFGIENEGAHAFGFEGDLLVILALTGVVGLILYLNIYRSAFKAAKKIRSVYRPGFASAVARGASAATVGLIISSWFSQTILFPAIMSCMWTLWGIIEAQTAVASGNDIQFSECPGFKGN